jgi:hypothetical protein
MNNSFKMWTRRILAFVFVLPYVGVASYLAVGGSGEAMTALVATGTAVGAFYFGMRAGSEKPES